MATEAGAPAGIAAPAASTPKPPIPRVIKRNTVLIAASQVCSGMGMGLLPTLGSLMVYQMLGSATFAGSATVIQGIARFLVAYPVGVIADRYGRKPAMVAGLLVAALGSLVVGSAVFINSFPLLLVGVLIFALATGGSMQLRVAATDMYPASRRAEGLGYILTGSIFGSIGKAGLVSLAAVVAPGMGVDPMALAWWLVPVVVAPALLLVLQIRPDPKEIALNLEKYYPGHGEEAGASRQHRDRRPGNFRVYIRDFTKLTIFVSHFGVQGNMSMIMVVTALTLTHHGHDLPAIAFSGMLHSLGMHAFAIPQGWLADRIGRKPIMLAGLMLAAMGTVLITTSPEYWIVTLGFFLVGFGWSGVHVAGTVLLADVTPPTERARVIGTNDTFAGAANMTLALIAGPVMGMAGIEFIGLISVALMVAPFLMILRMEPSHDTA